MHIVDTAADIKRKARLIATYLSSHAGSKRRRRIFGMLQTLTRLQAASVGCVTPYDTTLLHLYPFQLILEGINSRRARRESYGFQWEQKKVCKAL